VSFVARQRHSRLFDLPFEVERGRCQPSLMNDLIWLTDMRYGLLRIAWAILVVGCGGSDSTSRGAPEPVLPTTSADRHESLTEKMTDPRIKLTVLQLLRWLVAGDYAAIERATHGVRLSESLMQQAVAEYGRTLVIPPDSALDQLDVIEIDRSNPRAWSVRVDLWTLEEGRSDLSLECTLIDRPGDLLVVEIDNLHVL
jgi:hypothetical protein